MLTNARPIVLIPTTDRERAKTFYEEVLGLNFVSEDDFAVVFDSAGIMVRVTPVRELTPHQFAVLGWEVHNIFEAVAGLSGRGVEFERYDFPWMKQDDLGVWTAPDGTRVAWFKDPDGNLLSVTQRAK
jgi:catechol 2,3-dioxygenase-like lactoylglutathione lyase family enzyme